MNNKLKMIAAGVGALGLCLVPQAKANLSLIGTVSFSSPTFMANGSGAGGLTGATAITSVAPATLIGTLSYLPLTGATATIGTPIGFAANATTGLELWTASVGPDTYEFFSLGNAATAPTTTTVGPVTSTAVSLSGAGYAEEWDGGTEIAGPTYGTWSLGASASTFGVLTSFGFNGTSTTAPSVPDGGTGLVMLGGAFCALGALRRKLGSN